jgi:sugar lactone lactonase YvrE
MAGTRRRAAAAGALIALLGLAEPAAAGAQERPFLDVRVFSRVGNPGQPEPIAIGPDGRIYVGTNQQQRGDSRAPSKVFAFGRDGRLAQEYVLAGQHLEEDHGIQGLAFDGRGLLYVLDRSATPRVVVLNTRTGAQRDYAPLPDVPPCGSAGRTGDCSATTVDAPAAPNFPAFAPDGNLYVTDIQQALIWRVPPGGRRAEVWFTDPRLESPFGPNGIQVTGDGRTLIFALTGGGPQAGTPAVGALFKLPIEPDGRPGQLQRFWESRPFDGPDGFALAGSGTVYLALAGSNQLVVISREGAEQSRVPASPVENALYEVPFDGPASVAFLGRSVLVSNQSFPRGNPTSWAILDVFTAETGLPLFRPLIGRARLRLALRGRRGRAGRRRCFRGRIRATVTGTERGQAARAEFRRGARRVARDVRPPLSKIVDRGRHFGRSHTHVARARVRYVGGGLAVVKRRYRVCLRQRRIG